MNDLFQCTCPTCGQPMPEADNETTFDRFWRDVPHKIGKEPARKAWGKLTSADRAEAHKGVKLFYSWFERTYKDASPLHPATYLNGKRWQDEAVSGHISQWSDPSQALADSIASGKTFLCTNISSAKARDLVHRGFVTRDQCKAVGISI